MKEQLITLETAKLAKKKGYNPFELDNNLQKAIITFDNKTYIDTSKMSTRHYNFYKENNGIAECHEMRTGEMSSRYGLVDTVVEHYFGKETNSDYYHAPTQALLQKWLRDVHNIHVYLNPNLRANDVVMWDVSVYNVAKYKKHRKIGNSPEYITYEKALEAGLLEALKLIKT